jgi:hypothetical protein
VRTRTTVLAGATAAVGALAARVFRRRRLGEGGADPRAGELRQRLDESRAVVTEREEFEAAETTVDEVETVADVDERRPEDVDERRREIHERARAAADDMRRETE